MAPALAAFVSCGGAPEPRMAGGKGTAAAPVVEAGANGFAPAKAAPPADGIAARVNNEIITWKDVDDTLKGINTAKMAPDQRLQLRQRKLVDLAEERLFLQAARQYKLSVTEQEVDEEVRRDMKLFADEEKFESWIRTQGYTKTEYREVKRRSTLVRKLYYFLHHKAVQSPDEKTPGVMVDYVGPDEIRRYYEQNKERFLALEHLNVCRVGFQFRTSPEEAEKRALAESVLRRLDEGTDLYTLAPFYSEVWHTAADGRPQFWFKALKRQDASSLFAPDTVKMLFETLEEGKASPVWKDGNTLNVFFLQDRVSQREETFEEAQGGIRARLMNQKREENRMKLRDHLRKTAFLWPEKLFEGE
jgi:hypothetical protein